MISDTKTLIRKKRYKDFKSKWIYYKKNYKIRQVWWYTFKSSSMKDL